MGSPISGVTQAPANSQPEAAQPKTAAAPAAKTPQTPTDTVHLSSAAVQTPAQEIRETPAQTIQEAAKGDNQAKRLLAKEEAAAR
jgi:hypothetical protein